MEMIQYLMFKAISRSNYELYKPILRAYIKIQSMKNGINIAMRYKKLGENMVCLILYLHKAIKIILLIAITRQTLVDFIK
jgi:hypothetical protein